MQLKGTATRRLPSFGQNSAKTITKYLSRLVQKDAPAKLRGRYQTDFSGESKPLNKNGNFSRHTRIFTLAISRNTRQQIVLVQSLETKPNRYFSLSSMQRHLSAC